jgi:glutamine synthetase
LNKITAEYIWLDGQRPTAKLRSKTKIIDGPITGMDDLPEWTFDGSSTYQADSQNSDLVLKPVHYVPDTMHQQDDVLVLCEVLNPDNSEHWSNTRAKLRQIAKKYQEHDPLFGIEQEYTLFEGNQPLGWPSKGFPAPQGGYYCGVGHDEVFGRKIVEAHTTVCIRAGLKIGGINAEVMPAQWEFQMGPLPPLEISDELWFARWLLYRIGEEFGVNATLYPKPVKGDWNGAGAHTNFSIKSMREEGGFQAIQQAIQKLAERHSEHIKVYGAHNEERLTGLHETAPIHEFRFGNRDRTASVRIPMLTERQGKGYFEDRRPAANMDPYEVCAVMLETVCGM